MPKIEDAAPTAAPAKPKNGKAATDKAKATKAKNGKPAAAPPPVPEPEKVVRPVLYPELCVNGIPIPWESTIITEEIMKGLLWWETEAEYIERMKAEDPTLEARLKAAGKALGYGEDYMLKDEHGNKVRCHNNDNNRPFDETHAKKLAQDILNREWAGRLTMGDLQEFVYGADEPWTDPEGKTHSQGDPITLPEGTCNGEAIIIGRTGQCESIQHRGSGLILACQIWAKDEPDGYWRQRWPEKPCIESIVITGVSESPRVIKTIDNVKPRSLSDVFYTSPLFQHMDKGQRKECARMLAKACDLLMKRTGELSNAASHATYATHSESLGFVDRHPKLLDCLAHLFTCNQDRVISNMQLSPGQCSALMYLMGSSASSMDDYRSTSPPAEAALKWTRWKKACDFWTMIGEGDERTVAVKSCLAGLEDPDGGLTGRLREKLVILHRAWQAFVQGQDVTEEMIDLKGRENGTGDYAPNKNKPGHNEFIAWSCFGGCDVGDKPDLKAKSAENEQKDAELAKQQLRRERAEKVAQLALQVREGQRMSGKPDKTLEEETQDILAKRRVDGRAAGEVAAPPQVQYDKDGKPPAPKLKPAVIKGTNVPVPE